jgi:sodium/potassium-transporting ATPase subunit alpha
VYVPPLNVVFSTGPLAGLHWLCGIPWFLLCFLYDEGRKAAMRRSPGGWVERLTYW